MPKLINLGCCKGVVLPENNVKFSVGGSIETAVKGQYLINVKAVLSEAWQRTVKARMSINVALVAIFLFGTIVSYIASSFFGGIVEVFEDPKLLQIVNIIVTIAVWPFIAGVEMMGVLHAINKPTQSKMALSFLHRGSWVALCALLTSLLISIGFSLFFIPGLVLAVLLSLTIPLVVEKKLSPVQAVVLSVKSLRFQLFPLLVIFGLLLTSLLLLLMPFAILMESALAPLGIGAFLFGLSYLAPFYYNVKGVLYREIFGVYIAGKPSNTSSNVGEQQNAEHNGTDDTFSA